MVRDIESLQSPEYALIESKHLDPSVIMKKERLEAQIAKMERLITSKHEEQRLAGESSQNLQRTINQFLDLQKISIEKAISLSEADKENLSLSLKHFFESQRR